MGFGKEKIKQIGGLLVFAAVLVLIVMHSSLVYRGIVLCFDISKPFIIGGVIAFILNLPMRSMENKILGRWKGKAAKVLKRPISMVAAIIFVALILYLVVGTVVPQISQTFYDLGAKIPKFIEDTAAKLIKMSEDYPELTEQVIALQNIQVNWDAITDSVFGFLKSGVGNVLTSTVNMAGNIIGGVFNGVISFIFAIYLLAQKEKLADQGKRIISAYLSPNAGEWVLKVLSMLHKNFSSFISGQCLEAVILGTMFVIAMSIFRMPYAFMVGVLIAFTALIPIVGAFIGCVVGAFLILIENPVMAFWFVIMFLIIQQLEGNLIYPKVVGNSVGLPSIWVLMAVSLGGSLFGVPGMLFFIPLLATIYTLLRENVNARNARKGAEAMAEEEMSGEAQDENAINEEIEKAE